MIENTETFMGIPLNELIPLVRYDLITDYATWVEQYKIAAIKHEKMKGEEQKMRDENPSMITVSAADNYVTKPLDDATFDTGAKREALSLKYFKQMPLEAIAAAAAAFEYGAIKYADRNWEKGLPWQQLIDSLKRHVDDFERRKDFDDGPDGSDLPQICMIMASASMLAASYMRKIGVDDRMVAPNENAFSAKECAKWITENVKNSRVNPKKK